MSSLNITLILIMFCETVYEVTVLAELSPRSVYQPMLLQKANNGRNVVIYYYYDTIHC